MLNKTIIVKENMYLSYALAIKWALPLGIIAYNLSLSLYVIKTITEERKFEKK